MLAFREYYIQNITEVTQLSSTSKGSSPFSLNYVAAYFPAEGHELSSSLIFKRSDVSSLQQDWSFLQGSIYQFLPPELNLIWNLSFWDLLEPRKRKKCLKEALCDCLSFIPEELFMWFFFSSDVVKLLWRFPHSPSQAPVSHLQNYWAVIWCPTFWPINHAKIITHQTGQMRIEVGGTWKSSWAWRWSEHMWREYHSL